MSTKTNKQLLAEMSSRLDALELSYSKLEKGISKNMKLLEAIEERFAVAPPASGALSAMTVIESSGTNKKERSPTPVPGEGPLGMTRRRTVY